MLPLDVLFRYIPLTEFDKHYKEHYERKEIEVTVYHKRIVFHFKNGASFTVKLLDEKGIPIYTFINNNSGVEFESFPINRDRKPFTSLNSIIRSIENVYNKSIDRIEIKENTNGNSKN